MTLTFLHFDFKSKCLCAYQAAHRGDGGGIMTITYD